MVGLGNLRFLQVQQSVPSPPPDQKPSNAPIFVYSSAGIHRQKEKPAGGGGLFLTKGEWELEAPTQGEAMMRREAAAGALSGRGGAKRGDVTTSRGKKEGGTESRDSTTRRCIERRWHVKRLWHDKKPRGNQPGKWEAKARQEMDALAKALAEQWQWWVRQQSTKKRLRL
jgi:hypothetical protein